MVIRKSIVHIGTEKTGSTSLQRFLLANKRILLRHGILFPGEEAGQHKIALRAWDGFGTGAPLGSFDYRLYRKQLAEELCRHPNVPTVLSSEFFHSRVRTPEAISLLSTLLNDLNLEVDRILVYFRDQASLAQAAYAEMIKAGRKRPLAVDEICSDYYFDHYRIAKLWAQTFGAPRLSIHSYSRHKQHLVQHFCTTIGLPLDTPGLIWPKDVNRTPSPTIIEFLRRMNCKSLGLSPGDVCQKLPDADTFEQHSIFEASELQSIEKCFALGNNRLCAEFELNPAEFQPHYQHDPGRHPELTDEMFALLWDKVSIG